MRLAGAGAAPWFVGAAVVLVVAFEGAAVAGAL